MNTLLREEIFDRLNLSRDKVLDEMALLSANQRYSEHAMEVEYFEKKYNENFNSFDEKFRKSNVSYEMENDWMAWKFAEEGKNYWTSLLKDIEK
ncbi:MAG: hypothetical protein B6D61_05895 [Bacteroidetes bacterium 4484_249]|nr:MAG: hypothetical protein B6D61_05895 [Bacteroidetes bacterium 4484_249]